MNIDEVHKNITVRFAIVIFLALILLVPTLLVTSLVQSRSNFFDEAKRDIQDTWASNQVLIGPTIVLSVADTIGDDRELQRIAIMPNNVDISVHSTHEYRSRNIFRTPVLDLEVKAQGAFGPTDLAELLDRHEQVFVNHAIVSFALSDVRGIKNVELTVNGQNLPLDVFDTGYGKSLSAQVPSGLLESGGEFSFVANVRASESVHVVPHGDRSSVKMTSTWPHPSFDGQALPDNREVHDNGFEAAWEANALSRGFRSWLYLPGEGITAQGEMVGAWGRKVERRDWVQDPFGQDLSKVGYTVKDPVTPYRKVSRTATYGILFIVLTFGAILCIELVTPVQFHYVQYLVIGTGLVVFFLTLLSVAEHLGYGWGYLIAASIMTLMITAYTHLSARMTAITVTIFVLLLLLYSVLYTILQLETLSLLIGTGLLLVLLAALMWATKNLTVNEATLEK